MEHIGINIKIIFGHHAAQLTKISTFGAESHTDQNNQSEVERDANRKVVHLKVV